VSFNGSASGRIPSGWNGFALVTGAQPGLQDQPMHEASETARPLRQAAILAAAVKVFFQFGYRKTSMEDVATAAEVSRQTLYLQFRNKERLFRAALEYLTEQMLASIRRVADSRDGTVEETLIGIFEVLCRDSLAVSSQINVAELLAVARSQEGTVVSRFEADVLSVLADTLTRAGIAAQWERHGIGAQELALHLLDTSAGIKAATENLSDYKRRMALSIRIVVAGAMGDEA
jgi:AcrR family transcriptional regulator